MADEIRIDITAKDDASRKLDQVADKAEDLERLDPEVDVTADTAAATADLSELAGKVDTLDAETVTVDVTADTAKAESALSGLRSDLDLTGEKADETARKLDNVGGDGGGGLKTRGNAIADLTGPLGEASSAASDFAGIFDGLGDIAEDVAGKLGASQDVAAKASQALGGIGIAVAAGAAAWSFYKQRQEEAKRKQEELLKGQRDLNKALEEGNAQAAAAAFNEMYGTPVVQAAKLLGTEIKNVTDYVTGQSDALQGNVDKLRDQGGWAETVAGTIEQLRTRYSETNVTIGEQDAVVAALTESFRVQAAQAKKSEDANRDAADATEELGDETERAKNSIERANEAQEEARKAADKTRDAYDKLRGALDLEDTIGRFNEAWLIAVDNVQRGTPEAKSKVDELKRAYIDLADETDQNPIDVKSTLDKIDDGDLLTVKSDAESYFKNNPINATVRASGATVSGGGGGSVRPTSVPVDGGGGGTTIVNMSVPRGYRGDLLADARRATRRSGRRYQRGGV